MRGETWWIRGARKGYHLRKMGITTKDTEDGLSATEETGGRRGTSSSICRDISGKISKARQMREL